MQAKVKVVEYRRPNLGEVLHITQNVEGKIVLHPATVAPECCEIQLRPGDELRLEDIPEHLAEQLCSSVSEIVCFVGDYRFKFLFDITTMKNVSFYRFANLKVPIKLTVTYLAPSVLDLYPSQDELDFEF